MAGRVVMHSIRTREGWVVKSGEKVFSRHERQADAEKAATAEGRRLYQAGGLAQAVLHRADGQIREERTYGRDPERTPG